MTFLREKIGEKYFTVNPKIIFGEINSNLENRKFNVLTCDLKNNVLTFDCSSKIIDIFFWKCYSRKVLVKIKELNSGSLVEIFQVPSLLDLRPGPNLFTSNEIVNIVLLDLIAKHHWSETPTKE
jgi:hypothetical protein